MVTYLSTQVSSEENGLPHRHCQKSCPISNFFRKILADFLIAYAKTDKPVISELINQLEEILGDNGLNLEIKQGHPVNGKETILQVWVGYKQVVCIFIVGKECKKATIYVYEQRMDPP